MKKNQNISTNPILITCMQFISVLSKICLVFLSITFLYLVLVYWGDSIRHFSDFSQEDQIYYYNALKNTIFIFNISVIGILIFTTIVNYKFNYYSLILLLFGLVFTYVIPFVFIKFTDEEDFKNVLLLADILNSFLNSGRIILFLGIILYTKDLINNTSFTYNNFKKSIKKTPKPTKKKKIWGNHCWNTLYCTPELREHCPAYLLKKSCWKLGVGCCDLSVLLIPTGTEYAKKLLEVNSINNENKLSQLENCRKCHIFLVHQRRKYKTLLPLAVLFSFVIGYFIYGILWKFFEKTIISIDRFARFLMPNIGSINEMQELLFALVIFLVIVSILFIVSLTIQILHYSIFKLKL